MPPVVRNLNINMEDMKVKKQEKDSARAILETQKGEKNMNKSPSNPINGGPSRKKSQVLSSKERSKSRLEPFAPNASREGSQNPSIIKEIKALEAMNNQYSGSEDGDQSTKHQKENS